VCLFIVRSSWRELRIARAAGHVHVPFKKGALFNQKRNQKNAACCLVLGFKNRPSANVG
jgi:hypothetical protein